MIEFLEHQPPTGFEGGQNNDVERDVSSGQTLYE
jgi:hypothetical protein